MTKAADEPPAPGRGASISDVARHAGVSIATVSRILNGVRNKASPKTVARVQAAIRELGYRPSGAGQALRRRESRIVAVIAGNLSNPTMSAIAASVEVALREAGYVMVLCDSHDRPELQDEYLLEMKAHLVRAFVMLSAVRSPGLDALVSAGDPVLFVNRRNPAGATAAFVGIDNAAAAIEVAEHMLDQGCRRPLLIHASLASSATAERVAGFRRRMAAEPEAQVRVAGDDRLDHLQIGYEAARAVLQAEAPLPDAIFGLSDLLAYGAARAFGEAGRALPPIYGFDDNPLNAWIAPWLSSVRVPYRAFGAAISDALTRLWRQETEISLCLPHELILRRP